MAQNQKRDNVTFLIRSTLWPKIWQCHIPYEVNFMAHNVIRNSSKTVKGTKKLLKNSNEVNYAAQIQERDSVTFLIRSTLWPRMHVAKRVTALNPIKNRPFFQLV